MNTEWRKIVINADYGGFSISRKALDRYNELAAPNIIEEPDIGINDFGRDIPRDDHNLIKAIEELGEAANGTYANLKIIEIPADVDWTIQRYDGREWIAERHRTWS